MQQSEREAGGCLVDHRRARHVAVVHLNIASLLEPVPQAGVAVAP